MARILIVDDDETTRYSVGLMIQKMGHIPIFSGDGQHAYETLLVDPGIELLITDMLMPRMDGRDLIRAIRGHARFSQLPIVIMSAVLGPKEIYELLELGAARFQAKPLDVRELQENVDSCLEKGADKDL